MLFDPISPRILGAGLVSEESIPELRVVTVSIEQPVRLIRLLQLPLVHGVTQPAVIRLASELQYTARHHDGIPSAASPLTSG